VSVDGNVLPWLQKLRCARVKLHVDPSRRNFVPACYY